MKKSVEDIIGKVVVSCQAYEGTPFHGPESMQKMAQAAALGGAGGIRACWKQDVKAIKKVVDLPLIGINKIQVEGDPLDSIIITPSYESAKEIIEAGADIIALDGTCRGKRNFEELKELLKAIKNSYPDIAIMADIDSYESASYVYKTGLVDIISTTLSGYTRKTYQKVDHQKPNYDLIKKIKTNLDIPVNAEGRIWELAHLKAVIEAGADIVTIGTAITRPHLITKRFVDCNKKIRL